MAIQDMFFMKFVVILSPSCIVFFPDSIKSWNNIGSEFTSLSPISKFKEALLSVIRPAKKSVFGIHNPTGIKKLFQLRLGLSQLKSQKRITILLTHPPICASACLEDALFSLFQGLF